MEVVFRRMERIEQNVTQLGSRVDKTIDMYAKADQQKLKRQDALTKLIQAIAEVSALCLLHAAHLLAPLERPIPTFTIIL